MDPASDITLVRGPGGEPARPSMRLLVRRTGGSLLGLAAACVAVGQLGGAAAVAAPWVAALSLSLYVLVRQFPFDLGGVALSAAQAPLVPLWFVVDPALLPVVVLAAEVVARGPALRRVRRGGSGWLAVGRLLGGASAVAWPVVGAAAVLATAGPAAPHVGDLPVYALVFGAQAALTAFGVLVGPALDVMAGETSVLELSLRQRARLLLARWRLELAIVPLGLIAAATAVESPWTLLSLAPLAVLLGQFAKERDERMLRAQELAETYRGTAQLMGDVLEADDAYTGGEHTEGVVELSLAVGRRLGLGEQSMRNLEFGALLHDVGKLQVPNEIINKPGKLTDAEWAIIKQHPGYGQEMLDRVGGALSEAAPIVRAHHERWDGEGYPDRLAGAAIPVEARIITACDSFSAMTTNRSYRKAMTHHEAVAELERCAGTQFDPAVVVALRDAVVAHAPAAAGSPLAEVADGAAAGERQAASHGNDAAAAA